MNQGWEGQKLPNECLLMVIGCLHDHRRALHRLLLVNKLFFNAVVPLLYYNPLKDCTDSRGRFQVTREKCSQLGDLATLLLASVIHSQRAASQPQDANRSAKPFHVTRFLRKYGLRLPDWFSSPLMQGAVQGCSPTTIDYSKRLATPQCWDSCSFRGIIRAIEHWDRDNPRYHLDDDDSWDRSHREHDQYLESHDGDYYAYDGYCASDIHDRLSDLLLQCSPDSLESLIITKDRRFLQLPERMPRLRSVRLDRYEITQVQIDTLVAFINRHRAAYPGIHPLQIEFGAVWEAYFPGNMDYRIYAGSADSLAQRQKLCKSNNYRIMLYEAIGCPKTIDATLIPDFYYKAGNIGLDSLVKFTDGDSHRFFFGDGPKQGAFLQRCDNLRILELRIRDPDSFSWALERNQVGGTQRHTQRFLRNLEQLTITMDTSLNVLHDAVVAFGQQLQHLKVSGSVSFNTISHAAYLDPRFSNQTKVGDWDLPCLKTMDLDLFADSGIYIGQFHCPNLDSLSINIHRRFPTRDVSNPPDSDGPCSHMDSVIPSPVWKLPRLRSLELHCKAVMLFDFDSLDHMPALERLVMIAGSSDYQPIPTCCIPRLAAYRCHKRTRVEVEVSQTPDPTVGTKWKDHWDLPRLKALRLEGPPSSVFCFKWLASCPSLESIHLRTSRHFQRLPLLSSSKNATILPIEAPSETRLKVAGFENVDDSGFDQSMVPLVESKLEEITLQGTWVMSMQDLTNVLTVYAPNLKFLDVDRLHAVYYCGEEEPWHGLQFLKAVDDVIGLENRDPAQGIMNGASTSASGMRPGSRLMNVKSSYTLATKDAETMGMLCVNQWIKQDKWPGRDVPWFAFQNDDFFRPGGGIDTEPNSTEDHNQVSHV